MDELMYVQGMAVQSFFQFFAIVIIVIVRTSGYARPVGRQGCVFVCVIYRKREGWGKE
jgi:hypothetical protein